MSKGIGAVGTRASGYVRVTRISQVRVNPSGMRPESFARVRAERAGGGPMRPIQISVIRGQGAVVVDGRHRIAVARERGDKTVDAIIRYVGPRGGVRKTERRRIKIDG